MASSFTTNGVESTTRPCFEATCSNSTAGDANMWATDNGYTVTERYDQGADFNTADGKFTAPVTGRYLITWTVRYDNTPDEVYIHCGPVTSNVSRSSLSIWGDASLPRNYHWHSGSMVTDMDASDTAAINLYGSGSSTRAVEGQSTFSMCLMC